MNRILFYPNKQFVELVSNNLITVDQKIQESIQNHQPWIELSRHQLNTVPFLNFAHLRVIDLSYNNLSVINDLAHCPNLEQLNVSYNRIEHVADLVDCLSIRELICINNPISDSIYRVASHLGLLTQIVDIHKLFKIDPQAIYNWLSSRYDVISIEDDKNRDLVCDIVKSIISNPMIQQDFVKNIALFSTQAKRDSLIIGFFCLELQKNRSTLNVSEQVMRNLSLCCEKKFQILNLSGQTLLTFEFSSFKYLRHIECLNIAHNNISDLSWGVNYPNFKIVQAEHNQITNVPDLRGMRQLLHINLEHNPISSIPFDYFPQSLLSLKYTDPQSDALTTMIFPSNRTIPRLQKIFSSFEEVELLPYFQARPEIHILLIYSLQHPDVSAKILQEIVQVLKDYLCRISNTLDFSMEFTYHFSPQELTSNRDRIKYLFEHGHFLLKGISCLNFTCLREFLNKLVDDDILRMTLSSLVVEHLFTSWDPEGVWQRIKDLVREAYLSKRTLSDSAMDGLTEEDRQLWTARIRQFLPQLIRSPIMFTSSSIVRSSLTSSIIPSFLNVESNNPVEFPQKALEKIVKSHEAQLSRLDLSYMNITEIPRDMWPYFQYIKNLNLEGNSISDLSFLSSLPVLCHLNIRNNHIAILNHFDNCIALESLLADNNLISEISDFSRLTRIEEISLSNNRIENASSLFALPSVRSINLSKNKITELLFDPNNNISSMDLSYNLIEYFNINSVQNISHLDVSNNLLRDISICIDSNIESLNCSKNNLIEIEFLQNCQKLMHLDASYNSIREIPYLLFCRKLSIVPDILRNNPLSEKAAQNLMDYCEVAAFRISQHKFIR